MPRADDGRSDGRPYGYAYGSDDRYPQGRPYGHGSDGQRLDDDPGFGPDDPLAVILRPGSDHLGPPPGRYEAIRRAAARRRLLRAAAGAGLTCAVAALTAVLLAPGASEAPARPTVPLAPPPPASSSPAAPEPSASRPPSTPSFRSALPSPSSGPSRTPGARTGPSAVPRTAPPADRSAPATAERRTTEPTQTTRRDVPDVP
ncbi:hypothetical protein [Streptomyces galbus]|uniref:hypothetical protein n=1 Tax=Streptomyces galbus TaxID=33898 RepID=UPI001995FC65|nr:hypothetical protein [Streptomyces galbus]GHD43732.1 hypothetical protein GCM10010335_47660 [Streptomyces galbus]